MNSYSYFSSRQTQMKESVSMGQIDAAKGKQKLTFQRFLIQGFSLTV